MSLCFTARGARWGPQPGPRMTLASELLLNCFIPRSARTLPVTPDLPGSSVALGWQLLTQAVRTGMPVKHCVGRKSPERISKIYLKIDQWMCYHFSANFPCNFSCLFHSLEFCCPALQQFLHLSSPQRVCIFLSKKQGQKPLVCCLWTPVYVFALVA